jgi:Ankyrin repeats (3 copies)
MPPNQDDPEDVDDHYRRVSALDPSRPSESVRRAVLGYAAQLAAERAAKKDSPRRAARQTWWRPTIVGTLAAAALAGILIAPHFLTPRAPSLAEIAPASVSRSGASATQARPPAVESAPDRAADEPMSPVFREAQRSVEHRVSARNAAAKAVPPPPAAIAAQNATAASGAEAMTSITSTVSGGAVPPPPPAASAPMLLAGHLTYSAAALRRAAEIGDIPGLQAALDQRVDINARDAGGRTALMLATSHGQIAAVNALLSRGADPNATDARGTTPLQAAVAGDQGAIVAALKRAGAR